MTMTIPRPGAPKMPTYHERLIRLAVSQINEALTSMAESIESNNLFQVRIDLSNLSYGIGEVIRMREANQRAEERKTRMTHLRGLMTDAELVSELAELTVIANRLTHDQEV